MRAFYSVFAVLALATILFISFRTRSIRNMKLPHNEHFDPITASEAVGRLRQSPEREILFAVSNGFWDNDSDFDEIYAAYDRYYEERLKEFSHLLGTPLFAGHCMQDSYPVFAIGERVAVWGTGDEAIYLRLHHEDREVGIVVSLLSPKSPESNLEPKSIYEEIRKFERQRRKP